MDRKKLEKYKQIEEEKLKQLVRLALSKVYNWLERTPIKKKLGEYGLSEDCVWDWKELDFEVYVGMDLMSDEKDYVVTIKGAKGYDLCNFVQKVLWEEDRIKAHVVPALRR